MSTADSLLPVVLAADNFPLHPYHPYPVRNPLTNEQYIPFHLSPADHALDLPPVGLLRPQILAALLEEHAASGSESPWTFFRADPHRHDSKIVCVAFSPAVRAKGREAMSKAIADVAAKWKAAGKFPEALDGWRNELYTIYASPKSSALAKPTGAFSNTAFACERAACALFGFATFGVHMTAYEGQGADMKIWVPRRSPTKATWPSMLDNTVAGGITDGLNPIETMVKECDEEASLPESLVRSRLRNVGAATYFYITSAGFLQPEIEYLYDLPLPARDSPDYVLPRPHDDEVESFSLWTVPDVIKALRAGEFKPNCGLILIDFLVRHGLVTPENEPHYLELQWHMRRRIGVGVPA
ncbi:putative protein [Vanrija pseudolonga]|uniref:Purtative protein n=1 Tax=Vanrija pseudolonga TaxID=143232 RepID=A0AAF0Y8N8_9TREE|nr:purtative protein [Vanrija pseudolonga]